jgi:hypothetical protein
LLEGAKYLTKLLVVVVVVVIDVSTRRFPWGRAMPQDIDDDDDYDNDNDPGSPNQRSTPLP